MRFQVKVAIDATPLLGNKSGVGVMTQELLSKMAEQTAVSATGFLVSHRGRDELHSELPTGIRAHHMKFPARLSHLLWEKVDWPVLKGFDVVHGTNFVVPPSPGSAELVTIHDLTAWKFPQLLSERNQGFPRLIERCLARGAHVHAVSKYVAAEIEEYLGVAEDRISVIHNGSSPPRPGNAAKASEIVEGEFILAVGTIEPRKDYPTLVRSMEHVWNVYPELKLVIAGSKGWGVQQLDDAVKRCSRPSQVILPGFVTDLQRANLLAAAKLLAYPSIYEGFGLPLLEAMSVGLPVVASQIGAISEVAGSAALLVPAKSDTALAGAMMEILESESVANHLKKAGYRQAEAFSWDSAIEKLVALYKQLGNDNRG